MKKSYCVIEFRTLYDTDKKWYRMAGHYTPASAKHQIQQDRKVHGWNETQFRVLRITEIQETIFRDNRTS